MRGGNGSPWRRHKRSLTGRTLATDFVPGYSWKTGEEEIGEVSNEWKVS